MAVLTVRNHIRVPYQAHMGRSSSLNDLISLLRPRFGEIQYISNMIRQIDDMILEKLHLMESLADLSGVLGGSAEVTFDENTESEMLDFAIRLVDLNLASKPSG